MSVLAYLALSLVFSVCICVYIYIYTYIYIYIIKDDSVDLREISERIWCIILENIFI